ncbi:hypothetical protein F5Y15DRAFT_392839 [Xylariaceae sp. FL0016]|nr:hypothetical protein F5Y15DRAFT_392839 [Xylariaceae sp. FL0016]
MIYNIPKDTQLREIMARVKGGAVVSAGMLGGHAYVWFFWWRYAREFVEFVKNQGITGLHGPNSKVALIDSPSYPVPKYLTSDVMRGFTRCLVFHNCEANKAYSVLDTVQRVYKGVPDLFEDAWLSKTNSRLFILFRKLDYASRIFKWFKAAKIGMPATIRGQVQFAQDPCAGPLQQLRGPFRLARGEQPSIIDQWKRMREARDTPPKQTLCTSLDGAQWDKVMSCTPNNQPQTLPSSENIETVGTMTEAARLILPGHTSDAVTHDPSEGLQDDLVDKGPNPDGKTLVDCPLCHVKGDCKHGRVLAHDEFWADYDYEGYRRDPV